MKRYAIINIKIPYSEYFPDFIKIREYASLASAKNWMKTHYKTIQKTNELDHDIVILDKKNNGFLQVKK